MYGCGRGSCTAVMRTLPHCDMVVFYTCIYRAATGHTPAIHRLEVATTRCLPIAAAGARQQGGGAVHTAGHSPTAGGVPADAGVARRDRPVV